MPGGPCWLCTWVCRGRDLPAQALSARQQTPWSCAARRCSPLHVGAARPPQQLPAAPRRGRPQDMGCKECQGTGIKGFKLENYSGD
jgi:hypothetical protein